MKWDERKKKQKKTRLSEQKCIEKLSDEFREIMHPFAVENRNKCVCVFWKGEFKGCKIRLNMDAVINAMQNETQ